MFRKKKIISLMIMITMLVSLMNGCSRVQVAENQQQTESSQQSDAAPAATGSQEKNRESTGENAALGRYVEILEDD